MLTVGPISGLDATTDPYHIAPQNLTDLQNFLPDRGYGGLTTVRGRGPVTGIGKSILIPGNCTGCTVFHRFGGGADAYIFAATGSSGAGHLYYIFADGSNHITEITPLPGGALTGNQLTSFAAAGVWMFVTNGTDTPLKLDNSLNPTFWGIVAPTTHPTLTGSTTSPGNGGLSFGESPYYYCVTFGHTKTSNLDPELESSQGDITNPYTLTQAPATGTETCILATTAGTIFQFTLLIGGAITDYGPQVTTSGANTKNQLAADVARAINQGNKVPYQIGPIQGTIGVVATVSGAAISLQFNDSNGAALATGGFIQFYVDDFSASGGPYFNPNENAPATPTPGATQDTITLTNIPISTDPQVTNRNIYRLGGGLGQWRLVTTIKDDTTTTYVDTTPDTKLTGQALVISRDPPPAFNHIEAHQQRIFGAGTNQDSSQLWWSNYGEPWGFNALSNFVEVGESLQGDPIKGMASMGSVMAVFKSEAYYSLYGNSDVTWQTGLFKIGDIGCQSARSIATAYGLVGWVSRQGVYLWDGSSAPRNISDGNFQQSNIKQVIDANATQDLGKTVGFWYGRMYGISFSTTNWTYMFDMRSQGWWPLYMVMDQAIFDLESDQQLLAVRGGTNFVDQWFHYGTDLGNPIVASGTTRISSDPDYTWSKTLTFLMVDAPQSPQTTYGYQITTDPGPLETVWPPAPGSLSLSKGYPRHRITLPQTVCVDVQLAFSVTTTNTDTVLFKQSIYGIPDRQFAPETQTDS